MGCDICQRIFTLRRPRQRMREFSLWLVDRMEYRSDVTDFSVIVDFAKLAS
jgi:hypothetical protein